MDKSPFLSRLLNTTVIVASLGYFVDIYDLLLFSIVRIPSLAAIGIPQDELITKGAMLLNLQMGGMLLGGLMWGIMGDRRGRVSVLYGSIALYSVANLANAFVQTFAQYAVCRFFAGLGLAGELGAAITLVAEAMTQKDRGYGVAVVAGIGILGAIFAAGVAELFEWRVAYVVGGLMGLFLLIFRWKMHVSTMFQMVQSNKDIEKGRFSMFFSDRERFRKYMCCILIGAPNWFCIGILAGFAPEITTNLGSLEPITVSMAIAWAYLGLSAGDLLSGFVSQWIRSRRRVVFLDLCAAIPVIAIYLTQREQTPVFYSIIFFCLGLSNGYWAVMMTIAAEQFGTNLRATAATTVPNFIRAMVIPLTLSVQGLKAWLGLVPAVGIVAAGCIAIAFLALWNLDETYHRDLNFVES